MQEVLMDVLRALSSPNMDIRKKTLDIALDLITARNIDEVRSRRAPVVRYTLQEALQSAGEPSSFQLHVQSLQWDKPPPKPTVTKSCITCCGGLRVRLGKLSGKTCLKPEAGLDTNHVSSVRPHTSRHQFVALPGPAAGLPSPLCIPEVEA